MKANELMLGDWVQYGDIHPVKTRVLAISSAISSIDKGKYWHIEVEHEHANSMRIVPIYAVKPIPLTAEILKKNGFEKRNGEYQDVFYYYEDLDLLIDDRLEPCGYTLYGVFGFQIKYVHELQHALRLRGIEKEIKL